MKNLIYILLLFPITLLGQSHSEQRTYEYDDLNRLIKVVFHNGESYEYIYDDLGNRTQITAVTEVELTYVPDDNFEQALIDLGYDSGALDDYVFTHNINDIEVLYVSDLAIADLTGIEDFSALKNFECLNNNLTSIDISQNLNLERLYCSGNQITDLDISQNLNLKYLYCFNNEISSIDTSLNLYLLELDIHNNNIPTIDVSQNQLLEELNIGDTMVEDIDVSNNSNLKKLSCYRLGLQQLDITNNLSLTSLNCWDNNLTNLDLSYHNQLEYLQCFSNDLLSLDLKNNNNTILTYMRAQNNSNLQCIQVDDENNATNEIGSYEYWEKDSQTAYSEDCDEPLTYIPDDNFEQRLIDLGYDAGTLNDYVPTNNINTITYLYISSENISDLTGIEDFTLLEELLCESNQLTSLDLSQNNNLKSLWCSSNQLTDLDVSQNLELIQLGSSYNELSSLDLSQNSNLEWLECKQNELNTLNVKNGNNNILTEFHSDQNPNLYCIQVDNETSANNGVGAYTDWVKDSIASYGEDCDEPLTYVPDDGFEQALIDLGYDSGVLNNYVPTNNINGLNSLDIRYYEIEDLTGIEDFTSVSWLVISHNNLTTVNLQNNTNLHDLYVTNNQLESLDVSQNTLLETLKFSDNNISNINLSQNINLRFLVCGNNNLTELDLSSNLEMYRLYCSNNNIQNLDLSNHYYLDGLDVSDNDLYTLNIKNGNNQILDWVGAENNPTLMCIQVDDEVSANNNIGVYSGWTVDTQVNYGEDCNIQIPDDLIITLYPNPTDNIIYINNPYGAELTQMMIINVLGQEIVNTDVIGSYIDFSNLVSGTYFVYLQDAEGSDITITVVKE